MARGLYGAIVNGGIAGAEGADGAAGGAVGAVAGAVTAAGRAVTGAAGRVAEGGVYAPLYRNYLGDYVFKIESEYVEDLNKNLYLIVLTNDPEILLSREDGDSLSKSVEDISKEKQMFEKAYYESKIQNKIMINCGVDSPIEIAKIISEFILETENENIPKLPRTKSLENKLQLVARKELQNLSPQKIFPFFQIFSHNRDCLFKTTPDMIRLQI